MEDHGAEATLGVFVFLHGFVIGKQVEWRQLGDSVGVVGADFVVGLGIDVDDGGLVHEVEFEEDDIAEGGEVVVRGTEGVAAGGDSGSW